MSETKHTPWTVEPLVHPLGWGIFEGPRRMIAEVRGNGTDDEYRVALKMAASEEMLAALMDLRTMQRGRNEAIAKARGEA